MAGYSSMMASCAAVAAVVRAAPSAVASGYDGKGNGVPRGVPVADLGLARHQVDGLRLFAIERDAARETPADAAAAPPPPPTFAPIAFDFLRPPLDDPLD